MASWKHEVLKNALNVLSLPMYWRLPPVDHLRTLLETSTMLSTLPWGVTFEKRHFDSFYAECLHPSRSLPGKVMLYLHGGGYVIGSPHTHRALAGKIALGTRLTTLVIDYRKAPENPFPAALDDAHAAYLFLLEKGFSGENIVLAGDSAGGGLCIALQYKIRAEGLPLPLCSVLLSPYVDLTGTSHSLKRNAQNDRFLDVFEMRRWAEYYAGPHHLENPLISPLYGDLGGLPPMLVQASESEVLYDDSCQLVEKAQKAGLAVEFQTWKGLIHWWHMFGTMPEAKEAIQKIIGYINVRVTETAELAEPSDVL